MQAIYDRLTRTAIHSVKPENVATFLGRPLHPNYRDEIGNRFDTRIAGTRIKHTMGPVSLKTYDKHGFILRIETTVSDVSFFKHYRKVEHRDGTTETKWTAMKKGIYSLSPLREVLHAANRRYLEFISAIDTPTAGIEALRKVSASLRDGEHSYPGFNLFADEDQTLMEALVRGEHCIRGLSNKTLRRHFPQKTSAQIPRTLKRLRTHGLIKKVGHTYHYYLTRLGRTIAMAGLKVKELVIIPQLATALS
ncbi:MAG: MarR family transcriptional regulator [Candidatus Eremiobacteraeota bacterium]|nr:MarR family transcriptional regulator [Candidatus Eremiobacteraeota bacterium]MBC5825026.1 MarR family transcriptional regulator [Candidatus Eremiobacteraeota bacterium]